MPAPFDADAMVTGSASGRGGPQPGSPPVEGPERARFREQAQIDYMDSPCSVTPSGPRGRRADPHHRPASKEGENPQPRSSSWCRASRGCRVRPRASASPLRSPAPMTRHVEHVAPESRRWRPRTRATQGPPRAPGAARGFEHLLGRHGDQLPSGGSFDVGDRLHEAPDECPSSLESSETVNTPPSSRSARVREDASTLAAPSWATSRPGHPVGGHQVTGRTPATAAPALPSTNSPTAWPTALAASRSKASSSAAPTARPLVIRRCCHFPDRWSWWSRSWSGDGLHALESLGEQRIRLGRSRAERQEAWRWWSRRCSNRWRHFPHRHRRWRAGWSPSCRGWQVVVRRAGVLEQQRTVGVDGTGAAPVRHHLRNARRVGAQRCDGAAELVLDDHASSAARRCPARRVPHRQPG